MQIHIFENMIEKVESRWEIVLSVKRRKKHCTLDISHMFWFRVHAV